MNSVGAIAAGVAPPSFDDCSVGAGSLGRKSRAICPEFFSPGISYADGRPELLLEGIEKEHDMTRDNPPIAEDNDSVQDDGIIVPAAPVEAELPPTVVDALRALVIAFRSETEAVVAARDREIECAKEEKTLLEQEIAVLRDKIDEHRVELADLGAQLEAERAERQAIEAAAAMFVVTLESIRAKRQANAPVDDRKAMPVRAKRTRREKVSDAQGSSEGRASSGEELANVEPEGGQDRAATETVMTEADNDPLEETIEITLRVPARIVEEIDREVAGAAIIHARRACAL